MAKRKKPWTTKELVVLRDCWKQMSPKDLMKQLRPRSWTSIYQMATREGLKMGAPDGCASVYSEADRAGYTYGAFRKLLSRHNVPLVRGYKQNAPELSQATYVHPAAVDVAVKADMAMEYIGQASVRLKIGATQLSKLVKARGYQLANGRNKFPTDVFDQIAREWDGGRAEREAQRVLAIARSWSLRRRTALQNLKKVRQAA